MSVVDHTTVNLLRVVPHVMLPEIRRNVRHLVMRLLDAKIDVVKRLVRLSSVLKSSPTNHAGEWQCHRYVRLSISLSLPIRI
jgi:hypothetical protein